MRALAAALLVCVVPTAAEAFVCTRVEDDEGAETGPSVSWFSRNIGFALFAQGTNDMPADLEYVIVRNSFIPWRDAVECRPPNRDTDLSFIEQDLSTRDRIGFDFLAPETNENLFIFRDVDWPHIGQEGQIIALTTTTFNALTGEILDADIEFNSADFEFRDCAATACNMQSGSSDADLENTTVHEIGHMLGLGHTGVTSATMLARAQPGETEKRTLECDDRNAVVFKYPETGANGYCTPTTDCGFCAPPGVLRANPTVSIEDSDDGFGGCGCRSGSRLLVLPLVLFALRFARRRS